MNCEECGAPMSAYSDLIIEGEALICALCVAESHGE